MGVVQSSLGRQPATPTFSAPDVIRPGETTTGQPIAYGTLLPSTARAEHVRGYTFPPGRRVLPPRIDLRQAGCVPYPPVITQGSLGTCTSAAVTAAYQCALRHDQASQLPVPSVLYNYFYARGITGSQKRDSGTSVVAALESLTNDGVARQDLWPDNKTQVNQVPSLMAQQNALFQSALDWHPLTLSLVNLKTCLAQGHAFLYTFQVSVQNDQWFKDRNQQLQTNFMLLQDEVSQENVVAAHTVLVVGYDDTYNQQGAFLCRNSWGPNWGQNGHFWVDYQDMIFPSLASAFHVILTACAQPPQQPQVCLTQAQCQQHYSEQVCRPGLQYANGQ